MSQGIFRGASPATGSLWSGARPCVGTISFEFARAGHAASIQIGAVSIILEFILFDLLDATSQGFGKARATSIDLAQTGITAALSDGDQPIDAFNYLEIPFQCVGNEGIYGCRCVGKKVVDQFHRLRLVYGDPGHKHVVEPKDTKLMVEASPPSVARS